MTTIFQGAEREDFGTFNNTGFLSTAFSGYNASNARCSLRARGTGASAANGYEAIYTVAANDHWVHCMASHTRGGFHTTVNNLMSIFDQAGVERIGVFTDMSATTYIRIWNGSSWTQVTSNFATSLSGQFWPYDVYVKLGGAGVGEVRLYVNGFLACSNNVDTTFSGAVTSFSKARFNSCGGDTTDDSYYSEVIVADWNTIGAKLVTAAPIANGTYQEWTGAGYASIDEVAPDAALLLSGTVDQRVSVDVANVATLGSGESIKSVKISSYMNRDLGGPQNVNSFVRIGGTDYHSANQSAPVTLGLVGTYYETSPATSNTWTVSEINAAEFGIRSRA